MHKKKQRKIAKNRKSKEELLREHLGTLPKLREWPFHSESVFPKIGVVPRLLNYAW